MAVDPSRRAVLAASAAALPLLITACKGVQALGTPPPPAPDIQTLRSAISAEELMTARYRAAIRQTASVRSPGDQVVNLAFSSLLAEHEQHLTHLRAMLMQPSADATGPSASPAPGGPATVPSSVGRTISHLQTVEQAASDRLIRQLAGLPPQLAQLFASIAASEATHVPYLHSIRKSR